MSTITVVSIHLGDPQLPSVSLTHTSTRAGRAVRSIQHAAANSADDTLSVTSVNHLTSENQELRHQIQDGEAERINLRRRLTRALDENQTLQIRIQQTEGQGQTLRRDLASVRSRLEVQTIETNRIRRHNEQQGALRDQQNEALMRSLEGDLALVRVEAETLRAANRRLRRTIEEYRQSEEQALANAEQSSNYAQMLSVRINIAHTELQALKSSNAVLQVNLEKSQTLYWLAVLALSITVMRARGAYIPIYLGLIMAVVFYVVKLRRLSSRVPNNGSFWSVIFSDRRSFLCSVRYT